MKKAAVLSDIHSNYNALKACVEDALGQGAECFLFLGDYVSDLADPQASLDLVYELMDRYPCHLVRGNRERYMLGDAAFSPGSRTGSLWYTHQNLRPGDLDFFRRLPICRTIDLWGVPMELAHAAFDDDRRDFDDSDDRIELIFDEMRTRYLLTGHSHRQYIRAKGDKTVINPGSVGGHFGHGQLSQYALLEIENGEVRCRLRQIPYDLRGTIGQQFESGLAEYGRYWAITVLYNLLTGENWTFTLLQRVGNASDDEEAWKKACIDLGIPLTKEELLALCEK